MLLQDQVAIVTGAGSGIGRAIAEALAAEGAHVSIWDVQETAARDAAEAIRRNGGAASHATVDVSAAGPVRAEGRVIHAGKQIGTAEGKLVDADGKLYAHATTTCLVFDFPAK